MTTVAIQTLIDQIATETTASSKPSRDILRKRITLYTQTLEREEAHIASACVRAKDYRNKLDAAIEALHALEGGV